MKSIQFQYCGTVGRDLFIQEDSDVELDAVVSAQLPKIPRDMSIKCKFLILKA